MSKTLAVILHYNTLFAIELEDYTQNIRIV